MGERGIELALVGCGRMGHLHGANAAANPRFRIRWCCDANAESARELAASFGARAGQLDDMLADAEVAAVIVATPADVLLETALRCLDAGKPVFCEKPLASGAAELAEAVRRRLVGTPPLFVAFNRRFDRHFDALRRRLMAGEIGTLETLHLVNHDPEAPRAEFVRRSGGLFKDFSIHDFDTAAWLIGEPFTELFAWGSCLIDREIGRLGDIDTAKILLRTGTGRICLVSNSRRTGYGYDQRIEAFGSLGRLAVENRAVDRVVRWSEEGEAGSPIPYAFPDRYDEAYRAELDHFADVVQRETPPRTGARDALNALVLAEAAQRSLAAGAAVRISPESKE
jgi:myo-inositol 2-dehydrogenase / D-chiro-inositol 1-dehydrogenase